MPPYDRTRQDADVYVAPPDAVLDAGERAGEPGDGRQGLHREVDRIGQAR